MEMAGWWAAGRPNNTRNCIRGGQRRADACSGGLQLPVAEVVRVPDHDTRVDCRCCAPRGCACNLPCRRHQPQCALHPGGAHASCNAGVISCSRLTNHDALPIKMPHQSQCSSRRCCCSWRLPGRTAAGPRWRRWPAQGSVCVGGGGWGWGWGGGGGGGAAARQLVLGEACMSGAGERGECGERGGRKAVGLWMGRQLGNGSGPSREGGTGAAGAVCRGVQLPHQCCSSYRVGSG